MSNRRSQIVSISACVLVALSTLALAQGRDVTCKSTETQAECHARLKCKAAEELEDCQKRLASEATKDGNATQRDGAANKGGDRETNDRDRDREGRDNSDRGRDARDGRDDRDTRQRGGTQRDTGENRRGGRSGRRGFQTNKTFGLGLELGEPTGLNGKLFLSNVVALDFGVGWIYNHYYYGDGLHLYGDVLFHPISLVSASAFELPLYIGVGLRYWSFDYCDRNICTYGGSAIGIRVPVGISFDFNRVPLDIFIQAVPVLDFVSGDYYDRYNDRTHFGVDLSVGIRYWFK